MTSSTVQPTPGPGPDPELEQLINKLPEVYQPIYGRPDLSSSRSAESARLDVLLDLADGIGEHLRRPIRVLDLGSAQGYLAFRIAERGHGVVGIDYNAINVEVASALAARNPALDTSFIEGDVLDVAKLVDLDGFDLVIGMSVLHHVAYRDGHDRAQELVADLAVRIEHGVYEMALAAEPVYWAGALPDDPRVTLSAYPFIREVARVETHLSDVRRPVLFCSGSLALVNGVLAPFRRWTNRSHRATDEGHLRMMRYFTLEGSIVKIAARFSPRLEPQHIAPLRSELRRESHVLTALVGTDVEVPTLQEFAEGPDEVILARSTFDGELLDGILGLLDDAERTTITSQVLDTLARLEARGLYHTDLRLWNVLYDRPSRAARIIDHGAVRSVPDDAAWPNDVHFALLVFLASLWGSLTDHAGIDVPRTSGLNDAELSARPAALVVELLRHPVDGQVFRDLQRFWGGLVDDEDSRSSWPSVPLGWHFLALVEGRAASERSQARAAHAVLTEDFAHARRHIASVEAERDSVVARAAELSGHIERYELELARMRREHTAGEQQRRHLEATRAALDRALHDMERANQVLTDAFDSCRTDLLTARRQISREHELTAAMRRTVSWRITAPLRWLRRRL